MVANKLRSAPTLTSDAKVNLALTAQGVVVLSPLFSSARPPAEGALIETPDGARIPAPDLTRWYRADLRSRSSDIQSVVDALSSTAGVEWVEPDFLMNPAEDYPILSASEGSAAQRGDATTPAVQPQAFNDPLYAQQWHLDAAQVSQAWTWLSNNGLPPGGNRDIVVAVIDTGVDYTHPDLAANMWVNAVEFGGQPGVDDDHNGYVDDIHGADTVAADGNPQDDHGHGTHVAGIIAAQANNGAGGVGVAYNVQIMALKAAQYSGKLAAADVAEAIFYAVQKGADVINMSFGGYEPSQAIEDALASAFSTAVLVAAAGNNGVPNLPCPLGGDFYPAAYNWVLGVMASQQSGERAGFSNFECQPNDTHEYEVTAPGVDIWSSLPGDQYAAWNGTSMATPVVAGIAALARTRWSDKALYSSRFIMGQIASNTAGGAGGNVQALDTLTIDPTPHLTYTQHWIFDQAASGTPNDDDGIVDAGETIDLGLTIRNQWGKADPVTVAVEARGPVQTEPDPYVALLSGTVSYGAVGSFSQVDNGVTFDDGGLPTGVTNPFRLVVAPEAPNNHVIPLKITITALNGYDPADPHGPYVSVTYVNLLVQRGREVPTIISAEPVVGFDPKTDVAIANSAPLNVIPADMNKDGATDLVVADGGGWVRILNGNGAGAFAAPLSYAFSYGAQDVAVADFDSDGWPDVAGTTWDGHVTIWWNNGAGALTAGPTYSTGGQQSNAVTSGDMNGDGRPDLVIGHYWSGKEIGVLLNNGSRTFGTAHTTVLAGQPSDVVTVDLNRDGKLDVLAPIGYADGLAVLYGNGDGTFSSTSLITGGRPWNVVTADFDGDGSMDAAAAENSGGWAFIYLNDGNGALSLYNGIEVAEFDDRPRMLTSADFDDDGDADLAVGVLEHDLVKLYLNNGIASFTPLGAYAVGDAPAAIAAARLNSDNPIDLVTANSGQSLSILLNHGDAGNESGFRLTSNYYWLVTRPILVEQGATLRIDPGTQVEFWSAQDDPLNPNPQAYIQVEGHLVSEGAPDDPVELFPNPLRRLMAVHISEAATGVAELRYTRVQNPYLYTQVVDHALFTQEGEYVVPVSGPEAPRVNARQITNSRFLRVGSTSNRLTMTGDVETNLFDSSATDFHPTSASHNVFLKGYRYWPEGPNWWTSALVANLGQNYLTTFTDNAVLNDWWDLNLSHWMRVNAQGTRGQTFDFTNNYWGASDTLVDGCINDYLDDFNLPLVQYKPALASPSATIYPMVASVRWLIEDGTSVTTVGAGPVTFEVEFNRDMDTSVLPLVRFGPSRPYGDYTVPGAWIGPRLWRGQFTITPTTGEGYQFMNVSGAVAAGDPWLVSGDDAGRVRFQIATSGTASMALQAHAGEGYVELDWIQDSFDVLAGYNLYRSTTVDGSYSRLNNTIIPRQDTIWRDTTVTPGVTYYYYFTVVTTEVTDESGPSNVAQGAAVDSLPPIITHTPLTAATYGLSLSVPADVSDNVTVKSVTLYYRKTGLEPYTSVAMSRSTGDHYTATIPGSAVVTPGLDYYIEASDGVSTARHGSGAYPHQVAVSDKPTVTTVTPGKGPDTGGTTVTVAGSNFQAGASVKFGGEAATSIVVTNGNQITCIAPAHYASVVDVAVTNPSGGVGTLLKAFTYETAATTLELPTVHGAQNSDLRVPVDASNARGLVAASFTVTFDPAVVAPIGASAGSLAPGWSISADTAVPGQIRLAMIGGAAAVTGSGALAFLDLRVVGEPGSSTALGLTAVLLNDGNIAAETTPGLLEVDQVYSVSGSVRFWGSDAAVPGAELSLQGSRTFTGNSDASGAFVVRGAPADDYTLSPAKSDDADGINAYDASLALQHDSGVSSLTGYGLRAADVNKNGVVTAMDAQYILERSVNLITLPFPNAGIVWDFDPISRSYAGLNSDQYAQDFTALLLGDISGNWMPAASPESAVAQEHRAQTDGSADLVLQTATAFPDQDTTVNLVLENNTASVAAADLIITYDVSTADFVSAALGDATAGWLLAQNESSPGTIRLGLAGGSGLTQNGVLAHLTFHMLGQPGQSAALAFARSDLNEGRVTTAAEPTEIVIGSPLAVELAGFSANATATGVALAWETVSETGLAGFHIYRTGPHEPEVKINAALISASSPGATQGHVYEWVDRTVQPTTSYVYVLEDVGLDGVATRYSPVEVRTLPQTPNSVTVAALRAERSLPIPQPLAVVLLAIGLLLFTKAYGHAPESRNN